ncbi:hypothetical protein KNP414_01735 [Paenibacillus mucilaginosus KNP414]|uniref:NmrA-like domain-containing protein n=2 Tax=Paenibacillus mucilaginosus TaxID=61624 RepID=F8FQ77_PAEMK|nr:hypothetical protein KNP414_01735 [Paenibacillus mucilaginosus KNP414]
MAMTRVLVTGVTGNVGYEVAKKLQEMFVDMVGAVRNIEAARSKLGDEFTYVKLDYRSPETFIPALDGVNRIFLMFPPETDLPHFHSFIRCAKEQGIEHIVYLSVKDVQFLPFIPHYKNEKEITRQKISSTFLRAGYFMQNLNMFLLEELKTNNRIYVPAGRGETSFIDVRDVAEVAALTLTEEGKHRDKKYAITGNRSLDFYDVARVMSNILGRTITYSNPSIRDFKAYMVEKGLDESYVNAVVGVHIPTKLVLLELKRLDRIHLQGHGGRFAGYMCRSFLKRATQSGIRIRVVFL